MIQTLVAFGRWPKCPSAGEEGRLLRGKKRPESWEGKGESAQTGCLPGRGHGSTPDRKRVKKRKSGFLEVVVPVASKGMGAFSQ